MLWWWYRAVPGHSPKALPGGHQAPRWPDVRESLPFLSANWSLPLYPRSAIIIGLRFELENTILLPVRIVTEPLGRLVSRVWNRLMFNEFFGCVRGARGRADYLELSRLGQFHDRKLSIWITITNVHVLRAAVATRHGLEEVPVSLIPERVKACCGCACRLG